MPTLNSVDDAASLLAQACDRMGARAQLARVDVHCWRLLIIGSGTFQIEWSDTWGRLMFIAGLGRPPAGAERAALNLALSYNALWTRVGNLRMARDGRAGELLLIGELDLGHVEPLSFDSVLERFDALRRWWSDAVAQAGEDAPGPSMPLGQMVGRI